MNIDAAAMVGAVTRTVETIEKDGKPAKVVVATRTYPTDVEDLWDALTSVERIPRWFLPITGDLEVGGRYQLEGNAGGEVLSCDRPKRFEITWEFNGEVSWVSAELTGDGDEATLELRHTAHPPEEFWDQFGPGAVGVGWDGALMGLALHLQSGEAVDREAFAAWETSQEAKDFYKGSSAGWGEAAIADGDDPEIARRRAATTGAFYSGEAPPQA